ncbi:MAG: hypothetical protein J5449_03130 [Oscillospiraceae bacterium]|nr:hypothetical protein [Oscillospiraceae bacterium]
MKKQQSSTLTKIWYHALTITLLIVSYLLKKPVIFVVSDRIGATIAAVFTFAAHIMLLKTAQNIEGGGIKGPIWIGCGAIMLYQLLLFYPKEKIWHQVSILLLVFCYIFMAVYGTIELLVSLKKKLEEMKKIENKKDKGVESIESLIAIVTALVAIGLTCVGLLQNSNGV